MKSKMISHCMAPMLRRRRKGFLTNKINATFMLFSNNFIEVGILEILAYSVDYIDI